jgi:hypothetical protein
MADGLYYSYRGSTKGEEGSSKGLGDLFGIGKGIRLMDCCLFELVGVVLVRRIVAKGEFTDKTMVKILVAVVDFGFVECVFVVAVFRCNELL